MHTIPCDFDDAPAFHDVARNLDPHSAALHLSADEIHALVHALGLATETLHQDIAQFEAVRDALTNGESVPFFADGPGGVHAAEMILADFRHTVERAERLRELLAETDALLVVQER